MDFLDPAQVSAMAIAIRERLKPEVSENPLASPDTLRKLVGACETMPELIPKCGEIFLAVLDDTVDDYRVVLTRNAPRQWTSEHHGRAFGSWLGCEPSSSSSWNLINTMNMTVQSMAALAIAEGPHLPQDAWWKLLAGLLPTEQVTALCALMRKLNERFLGIRLEPSISKAGEHVNSLLQFLGGVGCHRDFVATLLDLTVNVFKVTHELGMLLTGYRTDRTLTNIVKKLIAGGHGAQPLALMILAESGTEDEILLSWLRQVAGSESADLKYPALRALAQSEPWQD